MWLAIIDVKFHLIVQNNKVKQYFITLLKSKLELFHNPKIMFVHFTPFVLRDTEKKNTLIYLVNIFSRGYPRYRLET